MYTRKLATKIILPLVLVTSVAVALSYAAPHSVKALKIEITDSAGAALPSGAVGVSYNFKVNVSIEDNELLPIKDIDLKIFNTDSPDTYYDLIPACFLVLQTTPHM